MCLPASTTQALENQTGMSGHNVITVVVRGRTGLGKPKWCKIADVMDVNRRSFVLGSALLPMAASAQPAARVNTGMIGVGNRGSYLLQTVLEQPEAKVVALCDK